MRLSIGSGDLKGKVTSMEVKVRHVKEGVVRMEKACDLCLEGGICGDESVGEVECSIRIEAGLKPPDKCCWYCKLRDSIENCSNPCNHPAPEVKFEECDVTGCGNEAIARIKYEGRLYCKEHLERMRFEVELIKESIEGVVYNDRG